MVIGIQSSGKGTAGGSRGVSAPSARPFRPNSNRLLRRRSFVLRRFGGSGSSVRRSGSGVGRSGSVSRGGSARAGGSSSVRRSGSVSSSGLFLLGTTGAQHEGNRNGAPDLCIHRQLPQYVSERKCTFAARTAQ